MASLRTEITEIVTGLGMLGFESLDEALAARPSKMVGVEYRHYDKLIAARADGKHEVQFEEAWANGMAFAVAEDGLREREPKRVEWKGPHQAPSYTPVHVEVRWSHGRFQGSPEAKVYLKTPHLETPGYTELS
ncbi:MAG: hypothetical protein OXN79_05775 [bacterium]|nr:hypothetical protein [bacterium]